jgi:hypothetical protein
MADALSIGKATLDLETDQSKFDKGLKDSHDKADSWGKKVGTVAKAAALSLAAVGVSAIALGVTFAKAAAEEQASIERVGRAIQNTGVKNFRALSDESERLIASWEKTTAFADSEMRDALAMLINMTGDYKQSIQQLPIAMDFARGAGIDLTTAAKLLGKVTDENTQILKKYGITVKEGAKETDVLLAVQQKFGGQAAAFAKTAQGQWQILTNQIDNLKEDIGAALLPVFSLFIGKAIEGVDALRNGPIPGLVAALVGKAGSVKDAALEMIGVITGKSPDAGVALKEIAGEEGAQKVMNVLAHIRNYVRDDLIPAFKEMGEKIREIIDETILPKWTSVQHVLQRVTGGALDLTTAFTGLAVVMIGLHVVEWTESVVLATKAVWAWVEAVRAGEIAAIALKLQLALFIAVGVLVVEAFLQVKETIELVMDNWDKFIYALKHNLLGDIPVFGHFFSMARNILGLIEGLIGAWQRLQEMLSSDQPARARYDERGEPIYEGPVVPGFAQGTDFVQKTGLAYLHRGEGVLTAEENAARQRASGAGVDRPIVIQVPLMVNGRELAYAQASYDNDQGHRYGIGVAG